MIPIPDDTQATKMIQLCDKLWESVQRLDLPDNDKATFRRVLDGAVLRILTNTYGDGSNPDD